MIWVILVSKLKKKKYTNLHIKDLEDRILMIDNSRVFQRHEENMILYCSTYSFRYPENIPVYIKRDVYEEYYNKIYQIISRYIRTIPLTPNYLKFQRVFYSIYTNELIKMNKQEKQHDNFWLLLRNILINRHITIFDNINIKYINHKISEHHNNN